MLTTVALLGAVHHEDILGSFQLAGYEIDSFPLTRRSTSALCAITEHRDIILIDVSTQPNSVVLQLKELNAAIGVGAIRPRVLCFSTAHRSSDFALEVQGSGARYVRISDTAMLLEAVELLLLEMNRLEQNGPVFRITHLYSQGLCGPGEEIAAVEMLGPDDNFRHLPLSLTERVIFEVLARHQRIALDSLQITSIVSSEWFFRSYGENGRCRQVVKLRRATVRVSVERIRKALAHVFEKAFDPYNVLRSCPAVGTNRVLYKLHGQVEWRHQRLKQ